MPITRNKIIQTETVNGKYFSLTSKKVGSIQPTYTVKEEGTVKLITSDRKKALKFFKLILKQTA